MMLISVLCLAKRGTALFVPESVGRGDGGAAEGEHRGSDTRFL